MKRKRKNKRDYKYARITVRMTKDDKIMLRRAASVRGMSLAAAAREALHEKYPEAFDPRNE